MENTTGRMGVGIISAGKVGAALGSALRAAGHTIIGAYASSDDSRDRLDAMLPGVPALDVETIVERAELVILALPTAEIAPLVAGLAKQDAWQAGQIVLHTSARLGTEVLEPAAQAGALTLAIHPALSFTGTSLDVARLAESRIAVSAATALQPIGLALVAEMGAEGFVVNSADRPVYDAALAHLRAGVQLTAAQAVHALETIGVPEPGEVARSLAATALERGLGGHPGQPDEPAVLASRSEALAALSGEDPLVAYAVDSSRLNSHTLTERAEKGGKISEKQANELHAIIDDLGSAPPAR